MFQTGISGTLDLGTEYGTADIPMGDFDKHFSKYVRPSRLQADDGGELHADLVDDAPEERPFLFTHMLPIAALLHIIDTATKNLHESVPRSRS